MSDAVTYLGAITLAALVITLLFRGRSLWFQCNDGPVLVRLFYWLAFLSPFVQILLSYLFPVTEHNLDQYALMMDVEIGLQALVWWPLIIMAFASNRRYGADVRDPRDL